MKNFLGKFKKEVKKITIKSSSLLELKKLQNEITLLIKRRKEAFETLGEKVYKMKLNDTFDMVELNKDFQAIDTIETAIKVKKDDIKEIQHKKAMELQKVDDLVEEESTNFNTCECGSLLEEGATKCSTCEKEIKNNEKNKNEDSTILCTCGKSVDVYLKFCPYCGKNLSK